MKIGFGPDCLRGMSVAPPGGGGGMNNFMVVSKNNGYERG